MPTPTALKHLLLQKWLAGLRACSASKMTMGVLERKRAIELSAYLAMASARNGTTRWSRAIVAKSIEDGDRRVLAERKRVRRDYSGLRKKTVLLKISGRARRRSFPRKKVLARSIAKRLVGKRTEVLRSLVPGGEGIENEVSLIEETLDYILFLQAQVDVMRCVAAGCR